MTVPPASGPGGSGSAASAPPVCYRHTDRETWIRCQRCDRPICPDCMRSAAVGFQCPECVREGARSTRQLRTPYGGQRVADPRLTTYVLMGINALVWLAILATGGNSSKIVNAFSLLPQGTCAANGGYYPGATEATCPASATWVHGVADGAYWQVLTSAFTHVEVLHIGFNMLALFFLGPMLETVLGRARFLTVYFVSALSASAAVMLFSNVHGATLGASGAIFGLMGALAVVALKVRGQLQSVLGWIALNLVFTFTVSGISWQGHIGGLVGGVVVGAAMVYAPRQHRSVVQWAGSAVVLLVSLALIGLRVAALG